MIKEKKHMNKIPFVDLKAQYFSIKNEIDTAIQNVINETAFIKGKYVQKFEEEFANMYGLKHCISCANGTDAIYITLKALGIGPGDEVITVANTWISTAETITQTGARPVFVDIHPDYYTIDVSKIEEKITEKTKAIILAAGDNGDELSMKSLLEDLPVALLDINGKSILERNIETLYQLGIQDVVVVRGFEKEKFNLNSISYVDNDNFENTFTLESIMCVRDKVDSRVLIMYSDVLYEKDIISRLLKRNEDIVLAIDRLHRLTEFRNNKLELVIAQDDPIDHKRVITIEKKNPIKKLGKRLSLDEANYEFIGISLFSKKGINQLMQEYDLAMEKYKTGTFHEAESFMKASLSDMLQEMLCKGYKINSMEVYKGWIEVHTFENYKTACQLYSHL